MKQKLKDELNSMYNKDSEGKVIQSILKPLFRTSTNYKSFPKVIPELDKTRITESAGYITAKQRIENMILAGKRLVQYRKEQFDFQYDEKIDFNYNDPTRSKNFDMADASQLELQTTERLREQKANMEQKNKESELKKSPPDVEKFNNPDDKDK